MGARQIRTDLAVRKGDMRKIRKCTWIIIYTVQKRPESRLMEGKPQINASEFSQLLSFVLSVSDITGPSNGIDEPSFHIVHAHTVQQSKLQHRHCQGGPFDSWYLRLVDGWRYCFEDSLAICQSPSIDWKDQHGRSRLSSIPKNQISRRKTTRTSWLYGRLGVGKGWHSSW